METVQRSSHWQTQPRLSLETWMSWPQLRRSRKQWNLSLKSPGSLRKTVHGMQIAFLSLPVALARKLGEMAKIRIGWSVCRIQMQMRPKRCFKCFEFGHIAVNCKSNADHTGKCFNCGLPGHNAKGCTKAPSCLLCARELTSGSSQQADHAAGSFKCPFFKEAMKNCKC